MKTHGGMALVLLSLALCPLAAQAESLWTCDVTVKAEGPDRVTIVKNDRPEDGPCGDYKVGQSYPVSPVLEPSGTYTFQIAIPEHMDLHGKAEAPSPQWVVKPVASEAK